MYADVYITMLWNHRQIVFVYNINILEITDVVLFRIDK